MIYEPETTSTEYIDELPRLSVSECKIHADDIRIIDHHGTPLIFFEDFEKILEEGGRLLVDVIHSNDLDIDKVGVLIDEGRIIRNPRICKIARNAIPSGKLFIRKMNLTRTTKLAEEALDYFYEHDDSSLFDSFVEGYDPEDKKHTPLQKMGVAIGQSFLQGAKPAVKDAKDDLVKSIKSAAKTAAAAAAVIGTGVAVAGHYARKYADDDARKHPAYRSELIKKLRVLVGKLPEYEGAYARAERENYEKKNILGKIIAKIKEAIRKITFKIKHFLTGNPYYYPET